MHFNKKRFVRRRIHKNIFNFNLFANLANNVNGVNGSCLIDDLQVR